MIEKFMLLNKMSFSSNISEAISAVLNFSLLFYKKILHAQKAQEAPKVPNAQKAQKSFEWIKVTYSLICIFVFFVHAKKRK